MSTNPDTLSTNSRPEAGASSLLPVWLVDGWKMTAESVSTEELAELEVAIKLINEARERGLLITLADLGVHFNIEGLSEAEAVDLDQVAPQPVLGTIEDKTVGNGSVPMIDPGMLGVNGLAQTNQRLQPPPAAGVIS
jgi:hypothetical protein